MKFIIFAILLAPLVLGAVFAGLRITGVVDTWAWEIGPALMGLIVYSFAAFTLHDLDIG